MGHDWGSKSEKCGDVWGSRVDKRDREQLKERVGRIDLCLRPGGDELDGSPIQLASSSIKTTDSRHLDHEMGRAL